MQRPVQFQYGQPWDAFFIRTSLHVRFLIHNGPCPPETADICRQPPTTERTIGGVMRTVSRLMIGVSAADG